MPLLPGEVRIDSTNWQQFISPRLPGGHTARHGLIPRDKTVPSGLRSFREAGIPLIPQSEWAGRLQSQIATKAQLSNIRDRGMYGQQIPSRDQNGKGYCWAHSGVSAHLLARAVAGEPYADLSAYAVACIIKGFRDEGGNGIEGVKFQQERGCPTSEFWPQQSMSRSNDKPETWTNAGLHKYVAYYELDHGQMEQQLVSCLLNNIPVIADYNWWSHSVCACDVVEIGKTGRIWNSWGQSWSAAGMGSLEWEKFIPDDAVACLWVSPSSK